MSGTIISVKYSETTKAKLKEWMSKFNIPNPVDVETIHTTIIFSKEHLGLPYSSTPVKWIGWGHDIRVFDNRKDPDKFTLVMAIMAPQLWDRHIFYRVNHNAPHDFPDYVPHITLSYDVPADFDKVSVHPMPGFNFEIIEEHIAPVDENWSGKDKRKAKR